MSEHERLTVESWQKYLDNDFEVMYETVFRPRGFSRDASLLAFEINKVYNAVTANNEKEDDDNGKQVD